MVIRATLIKATRIRATQTRATETRPTQIKALRIRVMAIRPTLIKTTRLRSITSRLTRAHLRCALTATTPITRMPVHLTATMDQAGSQAGSLLARGRGALAMGGADSTADVAFTAGLAWADAATMEAGRPSLAAADSEVGSVTVIPDVPSAAVDVPTVEAEVPSEVAGGPSVVAEDPSGEVATPSIAADAPSVVAVMAGEAEAAMVVGAGRFDHQLELLAADSTRCRPWRFS
jgi:hypothetical protein